MLNNISMRKIWVDILAFSTLKIPSQKFAAAEITWHHKEALLIIVFVFIQTTNYFFHVLVVKGLGHGFQSVKQGFRDFFEVRQAELVQSQQKIKMPNISYSLWNLFEFCCFWPFFTLYKSNKSVMKRMPHPSSNGEWVWPECKLQPIVNHFFMNRFALVHFLNFVQQNGGLLVKLDFDSIFNGTSSVLL